MNAARSLKGTLEAEVLTFRAASTQPKDRNHEISLRKERTISYVRQIAVAEQPTPGDLRRQSSPQGDATAAESLPAQRFLRPSSVSLAENN